MSTNNARETASGLPLVRLGVLGVNPIQYQVPLYQLLAHRGRVNLDVLFLHDWGTTAVYDPEFGVPVAWNDVDLLSGYRHRFLPSPGTLGRQSVRARALTRWIKAHNVIVIHGYSNPWMLLAAAICRHYGIPYLLRGDSGPDSRAEGVRSRLRDMLASEMVARSAGGLAVGRLNEQFYLKYAAPRVTFAPHSVDNDRFARPPEVSRAELLARYDLDPSLPVIMFCGKLQPRKRPLDLLAAVQRLAQPVTVLFVGDGALAGQVRASLLPGTGAVTGFVSQSDLHSYYHAADILALPSEHEPWGLVINEAMAAGVLPVVSDRVGAAPDLVAGLGEVFACGDIPDLAAALERTLRRAKDPGERDRARKRVEEYSVECTAVGFEQAARTAQETRATHAVWRATRTA